MLASVLGIIILVVVVIVVADIAGQALTEYCDDHVHSEPQLLNE